MARRVREHAWEATSLGSAEAWPQSLKAIVDMLLSNSFAMAALWGPELIEIYNDAYADLIGAKHPEALGRGARENWPEFWPLTAPVIERVKAGESCMFVDAPVVIPRGDKPEERWFTNSYSPLRDEKGAIAGVLVTLLETTERMRSVAALRESESRHRLALEVAELGTWTWNLETGVGDLDSRAAEIVGLPPGPITDGAAAQRACVHPDDIDRLQREYEAGTRTGEPFTVRYRVIRPDRTLRHVVSRARAVLDDGGRPIRLVGTNRDVTAEYELEQQRERFLADATLARAEADQADRAKDQFLITLSHELRTPLASVLLWARALQSGTVTAQDLGRATDAIVQSAESQLQLIEDLVDLSRLKSGLIQLDRQTHSIEEVARTTIQMIGPTAQAKGLIVELDVARDVGSAMFDRGRYQQVLWNLLTNAVKFTSDGGRVSLRIRKIAGQIEAVVADDGQGIDAAFLPQLFQRFRRADMREKRRYGGLGVGLALCRHLVDLHGGTIEAQSEGLGRGATFTVRIPWIAPEEDGELQDFIAVKPAAVPASLRGLRVLVVEDDDNMRDIMRWTLEGAGAEVLTVGSGNEALTVIDASDQSGSPPDVLVCDLGLPGLNGYDLIGRVLEHRRTRGKRAIPACAVSAFVRDVDRERAIDAGFDSYIKKPMTAQRLIEAVVELAAVASDSEFRA
jgi:signal transduction histidine kinase/CheY-like chemotaxis protein